MLLRELCEDNKVLRFNQILRYISPVSQDFAEQARLRQLELTKPVGSLGKLETLAERLAAIQLTIQPLIEHKAVVIFAADHGVAQEGVSAYPQQVSAQMVHNFLLGGAAVNTLARIAQASLLVVDVGIAADLPEHPRLLARKVAYGSKNFCREAALSDIKVDMALSVGAEAAHQLIGEGCNLLAAGEMGIANSTTAAALTAVLTGLPVEAVTGRGTGIDQAMWQHKCQVIERAIALHQPDPDDPWDLLVKLGGLEIAALVGFYLSAAAHRVAVVLDGFIGTAAALVAVKFNPHVGGYLFASHCSQEPGHALQLEHLGLEPLLNLDMRLGEASGATLALSLIESAAAVLANMATFEEARVSRQQKDQHEEP